VTPGLLFGKCGCNTTPFEANFYYRIVDGGGSLMSGKNKIWTIDTGNIKKVSLFQNPVGKNLRFDETSNKFFVGCIK
jgi:hypothetical protein